MGGRKPSLFFMDTIPIKIMQSYADTLILIANGVKSREDFFPIGISYPPGMHDYEMRRRLQVTFGVLGIGFTWDYVRGIIWVHETVKRAKARKKGMVKVNASSKTT